MYIRRLFSLLFGVCLLVSACTKAAPEEQTLRFSFSGGTGRVQIVCLKAEASAYGHVKTILFDSPHYQYVKIGDDQHDRVEDDALSADGVDVAALKESYPDGYSVFRFVAPENGTVEIKALTTAMSTPHEIDYTLMFGDAADVQEEEDTEGAQTLPGRQLSFIAPDALPGLTHTGDLDVRYAECFTVHLYEEGHRLIDVPESAQYLFVPEGAAVPEGLPEEITVLQAPLDRIYLAASNVMSLFFAMDGEDRVALTGLDESGWQIEGPGEAIASGRMIFAGKYSTPDYELLVQEGCDLAVENTMVLHSPEVIEKMVSLGIPVFIDRSSYETHPLGRLEWIRLYGVLCGLEEEADAFFEEQAAQVEALAAEHGQEEVPMEERLTVAFFAVTTQGTVTVRRGDDYIAQMIETAGGRYAFSDLVREGTKGGTETITMEEFYNTAADADILIYNAAIQAPLQKEADLIALDALFTDFAAVQNHRVYQVGKNLYQSTDTAGQLILDLYHILHGEEGGDMVFLEKLS
ncbi:MAG: ABC transporter substrate-binding protein [Lachnospiraceae bacterium]|nr:ABC transporter substrate-binding protein [Lachnospiraceae bacterium]